MQDQRRPVSGTDAAAFGRSHDHRNRFTRIARGPCGPRRKHRAHVGRGRLGDREIDESNIVVVVPAAEDRGARQRGNFHGHAARPCQEHRQAAEEHGVGGDDREDPDGAEAMPAVEGEEGQPNQHYDAEQRRQREHDQAWPGHRTQRIAARRSSAEQWNPPPQNDVNAEQERQCDAPRRQRVQAAARRDRIRRGQQAGNARHEQGEEPRDPRQPRGPILVQLRRVIAGVGIENHARPVPDTQRPHDAPHHEPRLVAAAAGISQAEQQVAALVEHEDRQRADQQRNHAVARAHDHAAAIGLEERRQREAAGNCQQHELHDGRR